jgi:hypothetical protein
MKKLIAAVALLLTVPALASAQNADNPYPAQWCFFLAPIVSNTRYVFNPAYTGVVFTPREPVPPDLFAHLRGGANVGSGG